MELVNLFTPDSISNSFKIFLHVFGVQGDANLSEVLVLMCWELAEDKMKWLKLNHFIYASFLELIY